VVYDSSAQAVETLAKQGAVGTTTLADFAKNLTKPRAIWMMVRTGVVDKVIENLLPF